MEPAVLLTHWCSRLHTVERGFLGLYIKDPHRPNILAINLSDILENYLTKLISNLMILTKFMLKIPCPEEKYGPPAHFLSSSLFPLLPFSPFPCFSQLGGSLSIQSLYVLSASLLNSNLKAGSRLATGKLSTEAPAPNTL